MLDCLFSCPHDVVSVTASPSTTQASVSQTLPSTVPQKTTGEHNPYYVIISLNTTVHFTDKSVVYSQPPSSADLMTLVAKKIPTKWYEVGVLLDIETPTLDSLETQTMDQVRLFMKVFNQWKQEGKVPYTWDTIISTLEKADDNNTATNIRKWLDKDQH